MTPEQVALRAYNIILEVMRQGSQKDGSNDTWLDKPERYHTDKAQRHIINHYLQADEPHLQNALVRVAMTICQEELDA